MRHPDDKDQRVGLNSLGRIIVQGDVPISSALLRAISEKGIGFVLLPGRGAGRPVNLFPSAQSQVALRQRQHRCFAQQAYRLTLAQKIISRKIEQQQFWLEKHTIHANFGKFQASLEKGTSMAALMGVEGAAAACYFDSWQALWKRPWYFSKRTRRPPLDPVNALLSLGYTLALGFVGKMAAIRGMDLAIGFLHMPQTGRPALALDLLEPLRPWVDQWVLQFLNEETLNPEHFTTNATEGCRMNKEGRSIFYAEWYRTEELWLRTPARNILGIVMAYLRTVSKTDQPLSSEGSKFS